VNIVSVIGGKFPWNLCSFSR